MSTQHFLEVIRRIRKRPGMYVTGEESYFEICAMINGVDLGTGTSPLAGFEEWIRHRLGVVSARVWPYYISDFYDEMADIDVSKTEFMFDLIESFFARH